MFEAGQAEAVRPFGPHAVDGDQLLGTGEGRLVAQPLDQREVLAFGAVCTMQLGRR